MGTSAIVLAFASFILLCGGVSSSGCRWEPIRLSFDGVRGGQKKSASPQLFSDSSCGGEKTRLTCSEGRYPEDITCNTGLLREDPNWDERSSPFVITLKYDHETVENSSCSVYFFSKGDDGKQFWFAGGECTTDIPDKTLPPFRMSNINSLIFHEYPEDFLSPNWCLVKEFIFVREKVWEVQNDRLGIPPPPVSFILNRYACSNGENTAVGDRNTFSTTYAHDGRRYKRKESD